MWQLTRDGRWEWDWKRSDAVRWHENCHLPKTNKAETNNSNVPTSTPISNNGFHEIMNDSSILISNEGYYKNHVIILEMFLRLLATRTPRVKCTPQLYVNMSVLSFIECRVTLYETRNCGTKRSSRSNAASMDRCSERWKPSSEGGSKFFRKIKSSLCSVHSPLIPQSAHTQRIRESIEAIRPKDPGMDGDTRGAPAK